MLAFQKGEVQFDYIAKVVRQYGKSASFACNLDVMCFCRALIFDINGFIYGLLALDCLWELYRNPEPGPQTRIRKNSFLTGTNLEQSHQGGTLPGKEEGGGGEEWHTQHPC